MQRTKAAPHRIRTLLGTLGLALRKASARCESAEVLDRPLPASFEEIPKCFPYPVTTCASQLSTRAR